MRNRKWLAVDFHIDGMRQQWSGFCIIFGRNRGERGACL